MSKEDYYQTLGVSRDSDAADIKRSYRRLAMKYHPDRNAGDSSSEEKFKQVQEAYEVLSNEEKRSTYDRFGHAAFDGMNGGGGGGGGGSGDFSSVFDDLFSNFFDGGGRQQQSRESRRVMELELGFEEAVLGCQKELKLSMPQACSTCGGSGAAAGSSPVTCRSCGGAGQVRAQRGFFTIQQTCGSCHGEGKTIDKPCKKCGGKGREAKTQRISAKIPAGIDNGGIIRLNVNKGGEIFLRVHVRSHPLFKRDGDDLHIAIPVSMVVAALGGTVEAPNIGGGRIKITIPAEIQSGRVLRLRGRGVANPNHGSCGDMLCQVVVETPVNLTGEQKKILQQFNKSISGGSNHSPKEKSWLEKAKGLFSD